MPSRRRPLVGSWGRHAGNKATGTSPNHRRAKVRFGVPLSEALKGDIIPVPLVDLIVYIAQEGVTTTDLFRRPGNPSDIKTIMKFMAEGRQVGLPNYNFYTLASVVKKFLLKIPSGVFGEETERRLLSVLELPTRMEQYDVTHNIIMSLAPATQQLLVLLFGTWFRIVNHAEFNTMSSEAVAKSVAGSLFHTCADDPQKIEKAVQVLQMLIDDFGVANMFGHKNLQYFADVTKTGIRVRERYRYEYHYPPEDSGQSDKSLQLFTLVLQKEATKRGFSINDNAISEEEFYGESSRSRADTNDSHQSAVKVHAPSSPPSPQSLQPQRRLEAVDDSNYNPHKTLTHVSSLSAPEVNQGLSVSPELSATRMQYLSTSLSRFDHVRRKQMIRLKKRSNWFLSSNPPPGGADREGSHDTSVGLLSVAGSSDLLLSDTAMSDGGASDSAAHDNVQITLDMDSAMNDNDASVATNASVDSLSSTQRTQLQPSDITDVNHQSHRPLHRLSPSSRGRPTPSPSPPSPLSRVTEKEVRYFMVENYYGSPAVKKPS